ncbi:hypothetical protein V6N11_013736 [Hibiscus sabdariffa]|uniref:Integrase catalytic domain-containing protein n=1 Tax=Hibiscus sabdariffa TaxID=183260 RepID=A0ABR2PCS3_9ROSI
MSEGSPVGAHVIKMMGYIQTLEKPGFALNDELAIDVVLQSLPDSFNQFVLNFNMNEINKTLPQLLGMLRTAECNMKKGGSKSILMVREAKVKGNKVAKSKGLDIGKETALFILRMARRLKQLEHQFRGLHMRRNLAKGDVDLRVGNGARVVALAVGTYVLSLPRKMTKAPFNAKSDRYGYIYLMRHKSVALEKFKEFKNQVQNQHCKSIKALRSDRGGEYLSQDFDELLKECGIVSQLTPPGTPQWNGVSERGNRTLLDMIRSMMSHLDLPTFFRGYELETAVFTLNRVPSKSVKKTPHEMWTGKRPGMSFMKVWGCKDYVKRQMSTKLEPKSHKCTFVGYPKETKGYYFYNPKENKVFVARTRVFLEKEFL